MGTCCCSPCCSHAFYHSFEPLYLIILDEQLVVVHIEHNCNHKSSTTHSQVDGGAPVGLLNATALTVACCRAYNQYGSLFLLSALSRHSTEHTSRNPFGVGSRLHPACARDSCSGATHIYRRQAICVILDMVLSVTVMIS